MALHSCKWATTTSWRAEYAGPLSGSQRLVAVVVAVVREGGRGGVRGGWVGGWVGGGGGGGGPRPGGSC
jgi:hypothetical protein